MSKAGAEHLKRGQRKWIEIWRDDYAQFLINDGTERIFAYTQAISSRISVIHGAMANDAEGYYDNLYGSYYQNAGDIGLFLDITWKDRRKKLLDVHFSHTGRFRYDDDDGWRGTGVLKGNTLVAENGGTKATITFGEKDIVRVRTNGTFKRDVDFDVEGSYAYK